MKKQYKITITQADRSYECYRVKLEDSNGATCCVYEPTIAQALKYAKVWCEKTEERQHTTEIMNNAIMESITLDRIAGITTSTSDSLD